MDDTEMRQKLEALDKKIDAVFASAEKTRKYFLWTVVATLVAFVLPLVGLLFAIPSFMSMYSSLGNIGI